MVEEAIWQSVRNLCFVVGAVGATVTMVLVGLLLAVTKCGEELEKIRKQFEE